MAIFRDRADADEEELAATLNKETLDLKFVSSIYHKEFDRTRS
jgi:hypothetical protein